MQTIIWAKKDKVGRVWLHKQARPLGKVTRKLASDTLDSSRVRFNWGYHDGVREFEIGPVPGIRVELKQLVDGRTVRTCNDHFDRAYAEGYRAGVAHAALRIAQETSELAWEAAGLQDTQGYWNGGEVVL